MASNDHIGNLSCVAGVLAGGLSRRMGRPKALLPHPTGGTLIEHVVGVALKVSEEVVIAGSSGPLPKSLIHLPVLSDARPNSGPLAALCALLSYAHDRWAVLIACDMPYLGPNLIRQLLTRAGEQVDAVAFSRPKLVGAYHACCALYHPRILPVATAELTKAKRALQNVLARVRVAVLETTPTIRRQLTNVNTPENHARACESLQVARRVPVAGSEDSRVLDTMSGQLGFSEHAIR